MAERSDMEQILAHRAEQILAGGIGFRRTADDDRQRAGFRPDCAAADWRVKHRHAAAGECSTAAPAVTSGSSFARSRSWTTSENPWLTRLRAIGPPMLPRPMNPTLPGMRHPPSMRADSV